MGKLLLSVNETAELMGIGRDKFYAMRSSEQLGILPLNMAGHPRYSTAEVKAYIHQSTLRGKLISRKDWQQERQKYIEAEGG